MCRRYSSGDRDILHLPEDVRAEVAERIRVFAPGGGFVFCPIHNIQPNTPPQNIQAAYEAALDYAHNRKVFGSPIVEYQLTQVKLGRMAMLIQAGRQSAYAVARMMGNGEGATEAAMVKAYVCKAAEWVTREAMQIHGGMGYAEEFTVSRLFVDARVLSIFEGADETLCLKVISRRLA